MIEMSRLRPIPMTAFRPEEPIGFHVFLYFRNPEMMLHFRRIGELITLFDIEMIRRLPASDVLGLPEEISADHESRSRIEAFSREDPGTLVERPLEMALTLQPLTPDSLKALVDRVPSMIANLRSLLRKLSFTPIAAFEQAFLLYADKDALVAHLQRSAAFSALLGAFAGLSTQTEYDDLVTAAILHDAGLSRMPRPLALKHIQGREEEVLATERSLYETHSRKTIEVVASAGIALSVDAARAIDHHHEYFDGSGPLGKSANSVFKLGQIIRLADELVTKMSHATQALDFKTTLSMLSAKKGKSQLPLFDPELLQRLSILLKR